MFLNACVRPQLYFVYWDMSRCLKTLTETLEEGSLVHGDIQVRPFVPLHRNSSTCKSTEIKLFLQKKLKKKLSHLVLVSDVPALATADPHTGHGSDEERPLLRNEEPPGCSTSSDQQVNSKVSSNHSLVPDSSLTAQVPRIAQGKAQSWTNSTPCWLLTYLHHSGCMSMGTQLRLKALTCTK